LLTAVTIYYQNNISNAALNYTAISNKLKHDKKLDMCKPSLNFHSIRAFRDRFESQIRDVILGVWVDSDRIYSTEERGYHIRVPAENLKLFAFYAPHPICVIYFRVKFQIASFTHTVLSYQVS